MQLKDEFIMNRALSLAKRGRGWTNPHPMVGAVIVKKGKIIAKGYHHRFGQNHAEMDALKNEKGDVRGATMYVTLEPCHIPYDLHGYRKPCTEAVREAGIQTVHIAMLDSNPEVAGKGRAVLEKAGINTTLGIMNRDALQLNEAYHHFMTRGRPFVVSTFSASLDGKIATRIGESKWITNEKARMFARRLRSEYQAILVGINTILLDNPHLGTRMKGKKDPIRIILDSTLKISLHSQALRDTNVIIATTKKADKQKVTNLTQKGVTVLQFEGDRIPLNLLMKELVKRKIISVLVEGGATVHGAFFDAGLVDKIYAFYAPIIIGGEKAKSAVEGIGVTRVRDALKLKQVTRRTFDDNFLLIGYPDRY